ncbi:signal recognition particle 9 kDa protein-like [Gossypium australe]|uniref:Signal recognition particle 9 kDa protein-like n=1 Tax=Gossypium australe TaxID=47621 RepID=A0A5B6W4R2_9ROSI|nr:signal recognition particle 9 kDa protein-like [Gossypium australe]
MVYITSWDEFVERTVQLFRADPESTRYCMKYRHCDGKLILKVTDNKEEFDGMITLLREKEIGKAKLLIKDSGRPSYNLRIEDLMAEKGLSPKVQCAVMAMVRYGHVVKDAVDKNPRLLKYLKLNVVTFRLLNEVHGISICLCYMPSGLLMLNYLTCYQCLKFKTDQAQDARKMEKLNNIFFTLMARGPDVDVSEITGKEQEAQPVKKGRGRKQ